MDIKKIYKFFFLLNFASNLLVFLFFQLISTKNAENA